MNKVLETIGKIVVMQEKMARGQIREYIDIIYEDQVVASVESREEAAEYLGCTISTVGHYFSRNSYKLNGHDLVYRLQLVD